MTDEQAKALGLRALAAGFRWAPGVWTTDGARCAGEGAWVESGELAVIYADANDGEAPDFRDDASRGVLLGQVREAWGEPTAYAAQERAAYAKPWRLWLPGEPVGYGATEAEALVDALEEAKRREVNSGQE